MPKMTIHSDKNTSRSRMCQPYARSATERNFNAKASSIKPNTTLMVFIQEPDLGACFSQEGNRAKSVNGRANAKAKPNIPMAGPTQLPDVAACTSKKPTMGAVQEKDTSTNVKAIRKIESNPVVEEALLSILLPHDSGSRSSNHPKKESANTTSSRKKKMLKTALVASSLSLCGSVKAVTSSPSDRNITMMAKP